MDTKKLMTQPERTTLCGGDVACFPGLVVTIERITMLRNYLIANPMTVTNVETPCGVYGCIASFALHTHRELGNANFTGASSELIPALNRIIEDRG